MMGYLKILRVFLESEKVKQLVFHMIGSETQLCSSTQKYSDLKVTDTG